jgi:hypothetical protein
MQSPGLALRVVSVTISPAFNSPRNSTLSSDMVMGAASTRTTSLPARPLCSFAKATRASRCLAVALASTMIADFSSCGSSTPRKPSVSLPVRTMTTDRPARSTLFCLPDSIFQAMNASLPARAISALAKHGPV